MIAFLLGSACAGNNKKRCKNQKCSCEWKRKKCRATNKKSCKTGKNKEMCLWKKRTCQVDCGVFRNRSKCKKEKKTCKWKKKKKKCVSK